MFFSAGPFGAAQKTLILAFEANSALSHENETKIVKITHSAFSYSFEIKNNFHFAFKY